MLSCSARCNCICDYSAGNAADAPQVLTSLEHVAPLSPPDTEPQLAQASVDCDSGRDGNPSCVMAASEPQARPTRSSFAPRFLPIAKDEERAVVNYHSEQEDKITSDMVDSEPSAKPARRLPSPKFPPNAKGEKPAVVNQSSAQTDTLPVSMWGSECSATPIRVSPAPACPHQSKGDELASVCGATEQIDSVKCAVAKRVSLTKPQPERMTSTPSVQFSVEGGESTTANTCSVRTDSADAVAEWDVSAEWAQTFFKQDRHQPDARKVTESTVFDHSPHTNLTVALAHSELSATLKHIEVARGTPRTAQGGEPSMIGKDMFEDLTMVAQQSHRSNGVPVTPVHSDVVTKLKESKSRVSIRQSMRSITDRMRSNSLDSRSLRTLGHRVRRKSGGIDEVVKNIVSFDGCENLLRGSNLSVILRNQASIFSSSSGSASTYAMSKTTQILDAFISHNWCVPRWQKWICLLLQFNARIAMPLTFVVTSPIGVIAAHGWVPTTHPSFAPYPRSFIFRLIAYPIFLLILCFYRDIVRCLPVRDPIVFLDKTCIHQEDKALQRQGIEKLGAFLCYSKRMVICYTDIYLSKLWTVYEVASFMALQSVDQMTVVPVMFPVVVIGCVSFIWFAGVFALWPELQFGFYYTGQICLFIVGYGVLIVNRKWSRSKCDIRRKMSQFNVHNCICFCENDRPLVYASIVELMKATDRVGRDANEGEALACFDNLVRNEIPTALITSVGKYGMRYEHAVGVGGGFVAVIMDQLVGLAHGMSYREFFTYALWYADIICFVVPSVLMGFAAWADRRLSFTGWREYAYLAVGLVLAFVPQVCMQILLDMLEKWANKSDLGMVVFVLLVLISSTLMRNAMNGSATGAPRRSPDFGIAEARSTKSGRSGGFLTAEI